MVDHATRDDDECFGVFASNLVDGLPTFLVARVGDGAGIHDKDIGVGIAVGNLISGRLETRRQGISLVQVDAAAQGFEGDFFTHSRFHSPKMTQCQTLLVPSQFG